MRRPPLLLLDEPADGLDLPGREALLAALAGSPASSLPRPSSSSRTTSRSSRRRSRTRCCCARGRAVACGAAPDVLADEPLSACFGVPVTVTRADGRWAARATPSW